MINNKFEHFIQNKCHRDIATITRHNKKAKQKQASSKKNCKMKHQFVRHFPQKFVYMS